MSGGQAIIGAAHKNNFCNKSDFLTYVPLFFRIAPHPNLLYSGKETVFYGTVKTYSLINPFTYSLPAIIYIMFYKT